MYALVFVVGYLCKDDCMKWDKFEWICSLSFFWTPCTFMIGHIVHPLIKHTLSVSLYGRAPHDLMGPDKPIITSHARTNWKLTSWPTIFLYSCICWFVMSRTQLYTGHRRHSKRIRLEVAYWGGMSITDSYITKGHVQLIHTFPIIQRTQTTHPINRMKPEDAHWSGMRMTDSYITEVMYN